MKKQIALSGAVLVATFGLAISAQAAEFYVSPQAEYINTDSSRDIEDGPYYGIGMGYQLTDRAALEFSALQGHSNQDGGGNDVRARRYNLNGVYNLTSGSGLVPYIIGGVGSSDVDREFAKDEESAYATMGAGVKYALTDRIRLRTEAKAYHNFESRGDTESGVMMGVDYVFGKKTTPAPAPVANDHVSMKLEVLFDTDKSNIKPQYDAEVKKAADFLAAHPNAKAVIEGHTDSTASDAYNQKLSERRANSVMNELVTKYNVDAARLSATGYGESKPVADNATVAGRQQNRRVMAEFDGVTISAE